MVCFMEYAIIITWLIIVIYAVTTLTRFFLNRGKMLEFQSYGKIDLPYVVIDIQGIPLNMIVDTGGGVSVLSSEIVAQLEYEKSNRRISMSALTDDSIQSNTVIIPFKVNGKEIKEHFIPYAEGEIGNFSTLYGIQMHGILGNEFLNDTGCTIDYKKHAIILH